MVRERRGAQVYYYIACDRNRINIQRMGSKKLDGCALSAES